MKDLVAEETIIPVAEEEIVPVVAEEEVVSPQQPFFSKDPDPDAIPEHKKPAMDARSFVNWSPDELSSVYETFGSGKKAQDYLAKATLEIINNSTKFYGMADFADVQSGTAEVLSYLNLPLSERNRGLGTSDQIMRYFTNLKQFGDPGVPTRTEAFLSGTLEAGGTLYAGVKGARYGAIAGTPFGPWGTAIGAGTGFIVGSVAGGLTGDLAGDLTMDQIDANRPLSPSTEGALKTWQATGTALPFILNPALAPTARITQAHLIRELPKQKFAGVLSEADKANPFIKKYLEDKSYKPLSALAWAEDLLISGGRAFQGATAGGKTAILATEALAVPATFGAVSTLQSVYGPRSEAATISGELLGGLAPNLSLLKHLPNLKEGLTNFIAEKKLVKKETGSFDPFGRRARTEKAKIQEILEYIIEKGENPDELLPLLEDMFLTPDGKLKAAFREKDPTTGKMKTSETFSSQFIESSALASLDSQVMRNMGDLDEVRQSSFGKSMSMQRALVEALRGTGDPNLLKTANQIQQSRIELLMRTRANQALETAILAVKRVYPDGGEKAAEVLGKNIADIMTRQREIFRNIEENVWLNVDGKVSQTVFGRFDPDSGEMIEGSSSAVPNVVAAWDRIVAEKATSVAEMIELQKDPDFQTVTETIAAFKTQLGLTSEINPLAKVPKPVTDFFEAYENASGDEWRDTFDKLILSNDFTRENGRIAPTQENINLLAKLVEDQRPNRLLQSFEKSKNNLAGKNDVYGNPYMNEALRVEQDALEGLYFSDPVLDLEKPASESRVAFEAVLETLPNSSGQSRADIVEIYNEQINNASTVEEVDAKLSDYIKQFSVKNQPAGGPLGPSDLDRTAIAFLTDEAALKKAIILNPPVPSSIGGMGQENLTRRPGTMQDAIEALNQAAIGLRQLGDVGKLRANALDDRRKYLSDRVTRNATEASGRLVESRPAGPLAALLDIQKKALIAQRRATNTAPVTTSKIEPLSANELIGFRKTLRRMNMKFNGPNGSDDSARITNELRRAALEDLMSYGETGAAYQEALDVSFAFNEYFKRTFGQDVLQKDSRGRLIVNPDAGMNTLFNGNPDAMSSRLLQIQRMGEQIAENAERFGATPDQLSKITLNLGTQDEVLHDAFTTLLSRETSAVEEKAGLTALEIKKRQLQRIRDWAKKNERVVAFFPSIQNQLEVINEPQEFIQAVEQSVARTKVYLNNTAAFKAANAGRNGITAENPTEIINQIYTSSNPSVQLRALAKNMATMPTEAEAQKVYAEMGKIFPEDGIFTPEQATEGLQRTVMDFAFQQAGVDSIKSGKGNFDAGVLYKVLFEKIPEARNESQTLGNFLEAQGALNESQKLSMKSALERIVAMQAQSAATGAEMPGIDVPAIMDLYTRIAGARIGQAIGGSMPGGRTTGIIEGAAGSKYARQITQEIPFLDQQDAMKRILLDPEKLILAMRTPRSAEEKQGIINTLIAFLKKPATLVKKGSLDVPLKESALRGPAASVEEITSEEVAPRPDPLEGSEKPPSGPDPLKLFQPPLRTLPTQEKKENVQDLLNKAREFLDNRDQSSLQPPLNEALPPVRQATVPNGVQTATAPVDPVGTTGIASLGGTSSIDVDKARKLFPNDITFAARGGAIHSGIGAFR